MNIAIIPARSGSKSIKNKNIAILAGKPLIAYTIQTALACKQIDKVIVSTDCREIAKIALKYKAEIPFLRPEILSQDNTPTLLVLKHTIGWYETKGIKIKIGICLQPTSPLRKAKQISQSIKILTEKKAEAVVSVCPVEHNPYFVMCRVKRSGYIDYPLIKMEKKIYKRQDSPKVYRINGAIYTFLRDTVMKKNTLFPKKNFPKKTIPLIMSQKDSVDIDSPLDLILAETILKNR